MKILKLKNILKGQTAFAATVGFITLLTATQTLAGAGSSGGGDLCEDRIQTIRNDLGVWIKNHGPDSLQLPKDISVDHYSNQMLDQIRKAKIRCIGEKDRGFPVQVFGTPKVCRFDKTNTNNWITCDLEKFNDLSESDQYILIHHEYASLANVERPNRDDSHYEVSNQISAYLTDQVVKKLAIKPGSVGHVTDSDNIACRRYYDSVERIAKTRKECVLLKSQFTFGTQTADVYFVCSNATTIVFELDFADAARKLKMIKDAGGCSPTGSTQVRCDHESRKSKSWTGSHNWGDSEWKLDGQEFFEAANVVPESTEYSRYVNCAPFNN